MILSFTLTQFEQVILMNQSTLLIHLSALIGIVGGKKEVFVHGATCMRSKLHVFFLEEKTIDDLNL